MTPSAPASTFAVGALLVAPGTLLPPTWRIADAAAGAGWSRLTAPFDEHSAERQLTADGWTFFFMASTITATAYGFRRPRMLDAVLAQLVAAAAQRQCNCLEIDRVSDSRLLGVPRVSIDAHPRHIQQGMVFSGR